MIARHSFFFVPKPSVRNLWDLECFPPPYLYTVSGNPEMNRKQPTLLTLLSAKRRSSDTFVENSGADGAESCQEAPVAAGDHDEKRT